MKRSTLVGVGVIALCATSMSAYGKTHDSGDQLGLSLNQDNYFGAKSHDGVVAVKYADAASGRASIARGGFGNAGIMRTAGG